MAATSCASSSTIDVTAAVVGGQITFLIACRRVNGEDDEDESATL